MKVRLANEQINELVWYLGGSSRTLDDGLKALGLKFEDIDDTSFQTIDTMIFKCVRCSWWYRIGELRGDDICENCATEECSGEEMYEDQIICSDYDAAARDESGPALE